MALYKDYSPVSVLIKHTKWFLWFNYVLVRDHRTIWFVRDQEPVQKVKVRWSLTWYLNGKSRIDEFFVNDIEKKYGSMTNRWRHCKVTDKTEEVYPWAEVVIFYKLAVWSWKSATKIFLILSAETIIICEIEWTYFDSNSKSRT